MVDRTARPQVNAAPREPSKVPDLAALKPGQEILEYRIDKVLGGGGFGITYLAQDVNLQLPVAIKEYFPASLAARAADLSVRVRSQDSAGQFDWGLARFIEEARALASFRHPNIVRVLRYFKENGTAYIVMEFESGHPLKRWVVRQPSLDQPTILRLVYPLLDGLEAVHRMNFLHRDIKPDNIYIRADGSPVLLDFGAARRLGGERDMTNVVSPGFAPFEQYHRKGRQGPWTDLYSLGAVMYWLTTGVKPTESAGRVQQDTMPRAVDVGSRAAFGEQLLHAIDWTLSPDEKQRPQSVAEFREALRNSEHIKTAVLTTPLRSDTAPARQTSAEEALRKNVMGTVMFLDLVAYSTRSVDQQVTIKALFNELIVKAIGGTDESSRILLDTGDGAAICFLGDPEEALLSAQLLRDLLRQKYNQQLSLRVGLHMGPVRKVLDINNRVNVVGDGINVAQRIMSFSAANQIMASRAYYEVITRISDDAPALFEFLGPRLDKHQRSHEIYLLVNPKPASQQRLHSDVNFAPTRMVATDDPLPASEVQQIEKDLTRAIGPLAHVLVKKSGHQAANTQDLRNLLSTFIQDTAAREIFLHPHRLPRVGKASGAATSVRSASGPGENPAFAGSSFSGREDGDSRFGNSSFSTSGRNDSTFGDQFGGLERALSKFIGPLAKALVRREVARHQNWDALLQALASHIDSVDDQKSFLKLVANE